LKHRTDEPTPLRQLRPEVPEAVSGVVRKLMAKQPAERYQTPMELVVALQGLLRGQGVVTVPTDSWNDPSHRTLPTHLENPFVGLDCTDTTPPTSVTPPEPRISPIRSRRLPLIIAGGIVALLLLGGLVIGLRSLLSPHIATQVAAGTTTPLQPSRRTPKDQH